MTHVNAIGIDLAKSIFHIYGADKAGKCLFKQKVKRNKLLSSLAAHKPCRVFMESCGSSYYWARKIQSLGHDVKLIAPQFVKPFLKSNKNDYLNSEAILEAGCRARVVHKLERY